MIFNDCKPHREYTDHGQLQRPEPYQRDAPTTAKQSDESREKGDGGSIEPPTHTVVIAQDRASPEISHHQREDVDHRQFAQPSSHERFGLGKRVKFRAQSDRRPGRKAVDWGEEIARGTVDRLRRTRPDAPGVGMPASSLIGIVARTRGLRHETVACRLFILVKKVGD
jgi:hypothetical protein